LKERWRKMSKRTNKEVVNTYLDNLYALSYKERPVDIIQFISDPKYLGQSTNNGKAIYPIWKKTLKRMFLDERKFLVVFTGSIGTGKTYTAYLATCYILYKIMCLKDPWHYFNLSESGKMNVTFFNLTKSLSASKGFQTLQIFLMRCPWFLENGGIVRGTTEQYVDLPLFSYSLASPYTKGFGNLGEHVICAIMDEVDSPIESAKQKIRILKAYEATVRRFESRFVINGKTLAKFFLIASKQDEMSFIEAFVEQNKNSGKLFVSDIPIWEAKPESHYSGVKFPVKVGDQYENPSILNNDTEVEKAIKDGFKVVHVPVEYKEYFERDMVGALRDIAGVSVRGIRRSKLFPSERFLKECYDKTKEDPVRFSTIDVGLNDEFDLIRYLDLTKLRKPKGDARFIHCDIAYTGDALGLACSYVNGYALVNTENEDGTFIRQRAPIIETEWVMRIKAKHQDSIPIHKIRKFILDLINLGYFIKKFTIDLRLASEDTIQLLKNAGVNADYLSVDKTIKPYMNFRNLVFEKRWIMHNHPYVHFELKNLEFDRTLQKVDHPEMVKDIEFLDDGNIKDVVLKGSKDMADAICGSVMGALIESASYVDTAEAVKMMKSLAGVASEEKDPFWFMNKGKEGGDKIVGTVEGEITQKHVDLLKRMTDG